MKKAKGLSQRKVTGCGLAFRLEKPVAAAASVPSSSTSTKAFWMTSSTVNPVGEEVRPEKSAVGERRQEGKAWSTHFLHFFQNNIKYCIYIVKPI